MRIAHSHWAFTKFALPKHPVHSGKARQCGNVTNNMAKTVVLPLLNQEIKNFNRFLQVREAFVLVVAKKFVPLHLTKHANGEKALSPKSVAKISNYKQMNGAQPLYPYIIANTLLLVAAICLLVSYRRKKKARQAEEMRAMELRKQEEQTVMLRYLAIFNTPLVDIVYYDANGVLTDLNQKACETFGQTREQILNGHYTIERYLNGKDLESFEYFHAVEKSDAREGDYHEVLVLPIRNKKGKLIGFFRTARDITGSVSFHHDLRKSSQKLEKANDSLRNYIDNINYALNVGGVRLANYSPESHTMSIFEDSTTIKFRLTREQCMNLLTEKSKPNTIKMLDSMDKRMAQDMEVHVCTTLRRKEGIPLQLQLKFQPIYDKEGNVKEYFGLCRDVSRLAATEEQLVEESQKAQEAESVKNSFLRNMSHEIRTPLASVIGFAELLDQSGTQEDQNMFVEQIKNNSAYLLNLVNDILYLSRLDANIIERKEQEIDVAECFGGFCDNGWDSYRKENVDYVVKNDYNHLTTIFADEHLGKIITYAAANAARHTESGSVTASFDYCNNKLVINFTDTSRGFSEEAQKDIFERFQSDKKGGTGLGLVICKRLVDKMNGTILLTSAQGEGTSLTITLPCKVTKTEKKKAL